VKEVLGGGFWKKDVLNYIYAYESKKVLFNVENGRDDGLCWELGNADGSDGCKADDGGSPGLSGTKGAP
jgi:hypothetical protein